MNTGLTYDLETEGRFSIISACILVPVYALAAALMAYVIDRIWNNGSVVERLHRSAS